MSTVQALINGTQARIKDGYKTQWQDIELLGYVNAAIDYIHKLLINNRSELALKYSDSPVSTSAGVGYYDLPGDFWAIFEGETRDRSGAHLLTATNHYYLQACSPDEALTASLSTQGQPSRFCLTANKLGLVPVPDGVYTVRLRYYFKSPEVALADNMPWLDIFNEPIKSFASSRAFSRRDMTALGEIEMYNELEQQAMQIISRREGRSVRINPRKS